MRISNGLGALSVLGLLALTAPAMAEFPEKPLTIIVPYGPGGLSDTVARVYGEAFTQLTGQSVVVENKPGASGVIAIEDLARRTPDGYTVMVGNVTTNAITPVLDADKFSIDYAKDITPIARLALAPGLLVANTSNEKFATLEGLIAEAKARPGELRYTSAGVGAYTHFDNELLDIAAGMDTSHLPASTGAQGMVQALLNGDAHFAWLNVSSAVGLVEDGQLYGLAVNTDERLPELPNVPTATELGFAGIGTYGWQGLFASSSVPEDVQEKLFDIFAEASKSELVTTTFKERIILDGIQESPEATREWVAQEMQHWTEVAATVPLD